MSQYDWLGGISKYFIQYKNNMLLKNFFIPALSEHVHKLTGSYHSISFRQDNGNHAHSWINIPVYTGNTILYQHYVENMGSPWLQYTMDQMF